jgi:hypothetical protein
VLWEEVKAELHDKKKAKGTKCASKRKKKANENRLKLF